MMTIPRNHNYGIPTLDRTAEEPTKTEIRVSSLLVNRGGRIVLNGLNIAFRQGVVTAVVGASGVGKSTLFATLTGLLSPVAGFVCFETIGRTDDRSALREIRRRSATIFQEHALIDRLTALDNVLLGLADRRHPLTLFPWSRAARVAAALALEDVGLLDKSLVRADRLSGGERQRVGIARALVRRPKVLLGDEPFSAVDPVLADQLGGTLRQLVHRDGLTVVLILHHLHLARAFADRIVGLRDGAVVFDGEVARFDGAAEATVFGRVAG